MEITQEKLAELKKLAEKLPIVEWYSMPVGVKRHAVFNKSRPESIVAISCTDMEGTLIGLGEKSAKYIAAANPETILALIAEIERLDKNAKIQTQFVNEYKRVAEIALGGEIPSPLPGHISSKERWLAQDTYLDCPHCGGSGHIGDCEGFVPDDLRKRIEEMYCEIGRLEREADQLAKYLADNAVEGSYEDAVAYWRETARKAMEEAGK